MQVFLSYAHPEVELAERVATALRASGHEVFRDRDSLTTGEAFHAPIRENLQASDCMVFFISAASLRSGSYCLSELEIARAQWPNSSRRVLPVMVGDVEISEVPGYLREGVSILFPKGSVPAEVEAALASWSDQSRDVAVRSKHSAMVLDIGPVTLFGVHASSAARVRATVNGTEFQYPSMRGIEWLEVGPQMSHQQFRLPDAPSFEVRFGMELDSGEELMSLHTDFVDDLPYSGSYVLHEVESGKRSLGVSAEVSYADSSCSLDASCLTSI